MLINSPEVCFYFFKFLSVRALQLSIYLNLSYFACHRSIVLAELKLFHTFDSLCKLLDIERAVYSCIARFTGFFVNWVLDIFL